MNFGVIPMDIGSDRDWDNINPYCVMDGKWGGFGLPYWFSKMPGQPKRNVVEREFYEGGCHWCRVWEDAIQAWRLLRPDEVSKLPDPRMGYQPWPDIPLEQMMENFKKFAFPIIGNMDGAAVLTDILGVQPMTGKA